MNDQTKAERVRHILAQVQILAAEYYEITGKPLGVTGEIAEYVAAEALGLQLAPPRTEGYDAIRLTPQGERRIQIKGRAFGDHSARSQRLGRIKRGAACDAVVLVLLDSATFEPREIWEADYATVEARLSIPGSKARDRGALGISEFKKIAFQIWPLERV